MSHANREGASRLASSNLKNIFLRTWYLGFTSFGGPVVHFQIFHRMFVEGSDPWLDDQTYQELFAICQSLPGPGSTKMGFCITLLRGGIVAALMEFLTWSLPGAVGMYALSIGVSRIGETLPLPVYALLSGLNAATVGVIALAGVQLASKAITDRVSRLIVVLSACAGLCYTTLWYFPVLMLIGGLTTTVWDNWARSTVGRLKAKWRRKRSLIRPVTTSDVPTTGTEDIVMERRDANPGYDTTSRRSVKSESRVSVQLSAGAGLETRVSTGRTIPGPIQQAHGINVKVGVVIIVSFFASFIAIMVANGVLKSAPLELRLFRNMYLAGTIIFGGGPVVIPLLREYVVVPGWVSPRDVLIGLAIIQAFPGPNFNFAVYLGALTFKPTQTPSVVGAILGWLGIFTPGIVLAVGFQSIWRVVRSQPTVIALLRGVNAAAVGLVFTAVYRLWEIGYLTPRTESGVSLGNEPWWVVVAVMAYTSTAWFGVETWIAILGGAVLGLLWYAAVKPW